MPAPSAVASNPYTAVLPYSSSAIVGPSVIHGPIEGEQRGGEHRDRDPDPRARADLAPALAEVLDDAPAHGRLAALARMDAREEGGGDQERDGVDRERPARPEPEHERARQRRPEEERDRLDRATGGPRLLDHLLRHGLRHEPGVGGAEERLGGAEQRLDDDDVPDLDAAGEDQRGEQRVQREADQVGRDHHAVARQPVGPDAAERDERHHRQRRGGQHDPDVRRRADLGHVQRQRDEDDLVADHARGLAAEQVAEVGLPEDAHGGR